jgi:signal transduction histidine kinase
MSHAAQSHQSLCAFLRSHRDALIQQWREHVLRDPRIPLAATLSEEQLLDHFPDLLDRLVAFLEQTQTAENGKSSGTAIGTSEVAMVHAQLRFEHGYTLEQALREFVQIRWTIVEGCKKGGIDLSGEHALLLHTAIDEGMVTAATEFARREAIGLRSAAEYRERLVGILGHDLRSPLTAIKTAVDLALRAFDETDAKSHALLLKSLQAAGKSVDRMTRMIADVMDFAKARLGGGIPVGRVPGDLGDICRDVITELRLAYPGREFRWEVTGDTRGSWDADRLAQVASNLLVNAMTYGPADAPVEVMVRDDGPAVTLCINNGGPPIPANEIPHIFDPFKRATEGTGGKTTDRLGLGLSIVKSIIDAHGGHVTVSSDAREGTTFVVRLPRDLA